MMYHLQEPTPPCSSPKRPSLYMRRSKTLTELSPHQMSQQQLQQPSSLATATTTTIRTKWTGGLKRTTSAYTHALPTLQSFKQRTTREYVDTDDVLSPGLGIFVHDRIDNGGGGVDPRELLSSSPQGSPKEEAANIDTARAVVAQEEEVEEELPSSIPTSPAKLPLPTPYVNTNSLMTRILLEQNSVPHHHRRSRKSHHRYQQRQPTYVSVITTKTGKAIVSLPQTGLPTPSSPNTAGSFAAAPPITPQSSHNSDKISTLSSDGTVTDTTPPSATFHPQHRQTLSLPNTPFISPKLRGDRRSDSSSDDSSSSNYSESDDEDSEWSEDVTVVATDDDDVEISSKSVTTDAHAAVVNVFFKKRRRNGIKRLKPHDTLVQRAETLALPMTPRAQISKDTAPLFSTSISSLRHRRLMKRGRVSIVSGGGNEDVDTVRCSHCRMTMRNRRALMIHEASCQIKQTPFLSSDYFKDTTMSGPDDEEDGGSSKDEGHRLQFKHSGINGSSVCGSPFSIQV